MQCSCCRFCTKRQVGCHATCEEYSEFVKQNEEEKKKIQELKRLDSIVHKFGSPGICCGKPTKRRTKINRIKVTANGSC